MNQTKIINEIEVLLFSLENESRLAALLILHYDDRFDNLQFSVI